MSLPNFTLLELPVRMEVDVDRLCPASDRYRVFGQQIYPLLVAARQVLELEAAYCLDNGRAGIEPVWLLGVGLLQFLERVPDRQAVELLKYHVGWNLALRRAVGEPLFHWSLLWVFRKRLVEHEQSRLVFQKILDGLVEVGLVPRRSRQRLDATQMFGLVSRLSCLDCVRESLRLALQELEQSLGQSTRPAFWAELWERYVESKLDYKAGSEALARKFQQAGQDAARLLDWGRGLAEGQAAQGEQMQLLQRVFAEQFELVGPERVATARPERPSDRVQNPHEPEAHYGAKGKGESKREHVGYKIQVAETANAQLLAQGEPTRQFLTGIVTQPAEQGDEAGVEPMEKQQAELGLEKPPVQYVDSAYISTAELLRAQAEGRQLIGPAAPSAQSNGSRFSSEDFAVKVEERRAVCPAGKENTQCSRLEEKQTGRVSYRFEWSTHCAECPLRAQCVAPGLRHRSLVVGEHHSVLQARRAEQRTPAFQEQCRQRIPIEGTLSELKRGHGLGRARYRGRARVELQNFFIGAACNAKRWINRVVWELKQSHAVQPLLLPSG